MLSVIYAEGVNKSIMLCVIMLSVIWLNVVMLSVVSAIFVEKYVKIDQFKH